jgi:Ice-binding-like/Bacterial Ig-like domain
MRKVTVSIIYFLAAVLVAFTAGCGQEVVTVPTVVSTIPANGATNVAVNTPISATFSIAMNPATLTAATFLVTGPGGAVVSGTVAYSGLTATFTPAAVLAYGTTYAATITTGAKDLGGASLTGNSGWTFTTITPPPIVTTTVPANGATGVPINQEISATFNEAMNCSTLASPASTFILTGPGATPVAGTVGCAGSIATFTPTAGLAANTIYTATITTGAQDIAGTPLAGNYMWTFRTVAALGPAPPTVISTVPVNGAVGVPINQALSATFSVAMIPTTINAATFTLSSPGGVSVTGVVTYVAAGSVAIFKPAASLLPSTVYTATLTTGAMDLAGTPLAQNYVWTFTTGPAAVVVPPTVISTIPINAATGVPLNQIVSATFSTAMNPATINSGTFSLTGSGNTAVTGLVAYAAIGNTLTFTPAANLAPNTVFTATITTGAQNLEGIPLAANYVWTFTTGAAAATTPPELVSTVPMNAATGVALNQALSATFSEAMNPLTITTATFQLTGPGGTMIVGTVSYNAIDFIATFTPTVPLTAGDTYTAMVTNGATDLAGNPLGNTGAPNPWSFTTGTAVVPPIVVLGPTITLFGGFAGTAGMTNTGTLTVINGDSGTTAVGFSSYTGFNDDSVVVAGIPQCQYTETPANIGLVTGTIYSPLVVPAPYVCPEGTAADIAIADEALAEANTAYTYLQGLPSTGVLAAELGSTTIYPGVYKNSSSVGITAGDLTLDAQGNPNATWVFQIGSTLTVGQAAIPRNVILANGAQAGNVYWAVGTDVPHLEQSGGGTFNGTVIANGSAGIAVSTAENTTITTINGRLISLNASTTLVDTVINVPAP